MIEKHLIHMQRSKKSRKHYKWADESGPGSWVSCLLLMLSFSHPGVSVVSPVFERCFKVILRSAVLSDKGPFIQVGDSPLNCVFSSMYNPLVVSHRAFDLYLKIDY